MAKQKVCPIRWPKPEGVKRRKIVVARGPLEFTIKQRDHENAKCGDPAECVIAQALLRCVGEVFVGVQVGAKVTKVITDTKVIRYGTPSKLKEALQKFDKTGIWKLPPGVYKLNVLAQSIVNQAELAKKRAHRRGRWRSGPSGKHRAIPSRRVLVVSGVV